MKEKTEVTISKFFDSLFDVNAKPMSFLPLDVFLQLIHQDSELVSIIKSQFSPEQIPDIKLSLQTCVALKSPSIHALWLSKQPILTFKQILEITKAAFEIIADEKLHFLFMGEKALFTINQMLNISESASYALSDEIVRDMVTRDKPLLIPEQILNITEIAQICLSNSYIRAFMTKQDPLFSIEDVLNSRYDFFKIIDVLEIKEIRNWLWDKTISLQEALAISSFAILALKNENICKHLLNDPSLALDNIFHMSLEAYLCLKTPEIFVLTQEPLALLSLKDLIEISFTAYLAFKNGAIRMLIERPNPQLLPKQLLDIKIAAYKAFNDAEVRQLALGENALFTLEDYLNLSIDASNALIHKDIRSLLTQENPKLMPEQILRMDYETYIALSRPGVLNDFRTGKIPFDELGQHDREKSASFGFFPDQKQTPDIHSKNPGESYSP